MILNYKSQNKLKLNFNIDFTSLAISALDSVIIKLSVHISAIRQKITKITNLNISINIQILQRKKYYQSNLFLKVKTSLARLK